MFEHQRAFYIRVFHLLIYPPGCMIANTHTAHTKYSFVRVIVATMRVRVRTYLTSVRVHINFEIKSKLTIA